jgi:aminopeptidase N
MNLYLTRHQYKNTSTEDLWSALKEASNKPVRAVMSTWTKVKGFPVVKVTSDQVGSDRKLVITQQKFCADGSSDSEYITFKLPGIVIYWYCIIEGPHPFLFYLILLQRFSRSASVLPYLFYCISAS